MLHVKQGTSPSKQAGKDDENFIDAGYEAMKVLDLRAMCRDKKLKQIGLKADLISRLRGEDSLEGPPFKRFQRPSLEQADQPPEHPAPPDQGGQPSNHPDQADQPPEPRAPPDQADQPANLANDVQNICGTGSADWLSAQEVQNMCAPNHGKIMERVMERAQTRECKVTGLTLYKILVDPPMRLPRVNGLHQVVIWFPVHSNSDSS